MSYIQSLFSHAPGCRFPDYGECTCGERDKYVASEIEAGRCPFGHWKEGDPGMVGLCHLGLPGCGCADEEMVNPHFEAERQQLDQLAAEHDRLLDSGEIER